MQLKVEEMKSIESAYRGAVDKSIRCASCYIAEFMYEEGTEEAERELKE